jgi:hypothetical protein
VRLSTRNAFKEFGVRPVGITPPGAVTLKEGWARIKEGYRQDIFAIKKMFGGGAKVPKSTIKTDPVMDNNFEIYQAAEESKYSTVYRFDTEGEPYFMKSKLATMGTSEEIQRWQSMRENPVLAIARARKHMISGGTMRKGLPGEIPSPFVSVTEDLVGLTESTDPSVQTIIRGFTEATNEPYPGFAKAKNLIEIEVPKNELIKLEKFLTNKEINQQGAFVKKEGEALIESMDLMKQAQKQGWKIKVTPNPY